jgi:hypothetical protein
MNLVKPRVAFFGPVAEHNMPCVVCWEKPAVYSFNGAIFEPCWDCQKDGWAIHKTKRRSWLAWFFP